MPNTDGPIELANAAGSGRKPTTVPPPPAKSSELSPRSQRRTFSATAKLRILEETDRAADTGEQGRGDVLHVPPKKADLIEGQVTCGTRE